MTERAGRVLVIDDNPLSRELVIAVLDSLACDVVTAATAEAGLALAAAERPDLILLDMRLPGMSGWDAIRAIRGRPEWQGVPVVAVTAQAMHGDEARAVRAGFGAYLTKPIDNRRLREIVREYLLARRPA